MSNHDLVERKHKGREFLAGAALVAAFLGAGWIDAHSDPSETTTTTEVTCNEDEDRVEISSWDGEGHVTRGTYCIPLDNDEWSGITWVDR